jgi:hypothetical protein
LAPKLYLLTQLGAFLQIGRIDPARHMPPEQLEALRKAALRFGIPRALTRYALALALNGQPAEAARQLGVLRHIWGDALYARTKAEFQALAAGPYPELREVALP